MNFEKVALHFFSRIKDEAEKAQDLLDPINNEKIDLQLIQVKLANIIYYSRLVIEKWKLD